MAAVRRACYTARVTFADKSNRPGPAARRTLASSTAAAWLALVLAVFAPSLALASSRSGVEGATGAAVEGAGASARLSTGEASAGTMSAPDAGAALRERALGRRQAAHEAKVVTRTGARASAALLGAGTLPRAAAAAAPLAVAAATGGCARPAVGPGNGRDTHLRIGLFLI